MGYRNTQVRTLTHAHIMFSLFDALISNSSPRCNPSLIAGYPRARRYVRCDLPATRTPCDPGLKLRRYVTPLHSTHRCGVGTRWGRGRRRRSRGDVEVAEKAAQQRRRWRRRRRRLWAIRRQRRTAPRAARRGAVRRPSAGPGQPVTVRSWTVEQR